MSLAWYILWFIVAVSLLVTVHEYGHYWVARRLGFKVLRFSVGFGKPLLRKVGRGPDKTEYVVAAIPLGGYVKLLDEREGPVATGELERSFTRKPPWQRILVLLAGPAFNIAFAILVLWGMFWAGGITDPKPVIGDVIADSVSARAGLRSGDEVVAINGQPSTARRDVVFGLLDAMSASGNVGLTVRGTDGSTRSVDLVVSDAETRRRLTEPDSLLRGLGFDFWQPPVPAVLAQVIPDGPAARAGLHPGDEIIAINRESIGSFSELFDKVTANPGESLIVRYRRNGSEANTRVEVGVAEVGGAKVGRIGVQRQAYVEFPESMIVHTDLSPVAALSQAAGEAWDMTVLQGRLFWRMLLGNVSLKNLSGPLSIAEFAGDSAEAGVVSFMHFLVLISLSLGILNLLPIPILDGGQIVFQLVEWAKGSPLSERAQIFGQQVGIALLILLMSVALFNDIARQLS